MLKRVFSNPFSRALHSSEIAVPIGLASKMEINQFLEPDANPTSLVGELSNKCFVVGHEPNLSSLAKILIREPQGYLQPKKPVTSISNGETT